MIIQAAPFFKDPVTNQIFEWTEKLAKVAPSRQLVPYDPKDATVSQGLKLGAPTTKKIERNDVTYMTKVQLQNEAAKFRAMLDLRKRVDDLRMEVKELQDNE